MSKEITKQEAAEIQKASSQAVATVSTRFLADVERQFAAQMGGGRQFTELEKRLTQHMYLSVDQALKNAEADRIKRNRGGSEFNWHNIDRTKLALDTVHRVSLGLDALIPNHIWPVSYFNSAKQQYDVDLRVGYVGRDFVARRHALDEPLDIIYELVYDTDTFKALPRSASREVESYDFEISNPFDRGKIIGGFGYIVHEDPRKNRLVLVTQRDFKRSRGASKSSFWNDNDVEMHYKTVVHRVATRVPMDPEKVNAAAFAALLEDERSESDAAHVTLDVEAKQNANRQLVDIEVEAPQAAPEATPAAAPPAEDGSLFNEAPPF